MLNLAEIEREIRTLENGQMTYPVCEKLSVLYTILDHHTKEETPENAYSFASAPPTSEFLNIVNGAPLDGVLQILDEHMECIKAIYPKEYQMIIERISSLL